MRRGLDEVRLFDLPLLVSFEVGCPDGPSVVLDIVRGDGDAAGFATKATLPRFIGQVEAIICFVGDVGRPREVGIGIVQSVYERTS